VIPPSLNVEARSTMALTAYSGKVSFLRVHEVSSKFGPPNDQIDVEVVFQLAGVAGKSFGLQLRNDTNRLTHYAALDLLRDAFANGYKVLTDADFTGTHKNAVVFVGRVAIQRP
jgi:hypothetical protein